MKPLQLFCSGLWFVGALAAPGPRLTSASWVTQATSQGNGFSAGTLHIAQNLAAGTTLTVDNLLPGDDFDAEVDVANSGSLLLVYSVTSSTSGDSGLANALHLTVRARATQTCSVRDGSVLYDGSLADAAVGDPAHGVQPGDRVLTSGATDAVCFTVELPSTATATVAAKSVAATFSFVAEQS